MVHNISRKSLIFLILVMQILPALAIDEYAPSMPSMVKFFSTSITSVQLSITVFLLTLGFVQLFAGPLSDRFGRRKVLMPGLVVYLLGSLVCIFAPSISVLLLGRALQGVGMGVVDTSATAVTGDSFKGKDLNVVSSYLVIAYSVVPILAPVIGGYLQQMWHWHANFIFLFILPLVAFLLLLTRLPETHIPSVQHSLRPKQLFRNYGMLLSDRTYVSSVICATLAFSAVVVFSVIAPFLLQGRLKITPAQYGHVALFVGVGFLIGSLLNTRLLKKMTISSITILGLCISLIASLVMFGFSYRAHVSIWAVIIPTFVVIFTVGMTFPNFFAQALGRFPAFTGIGGALMHCGILLGCVVITALVTLVKANAFYSLAGSYLVLTILSLFFFWLSQHDASHHKKK